MVLWGVIVLSPVSSAQNYTKRLILKDGSYQSATKWEVQGDRVHFFSAERNEWEDIPSEMIDWDKTNQFERDRVSGKKTPEAEALDRELAAERQEEEAKSPQVAPGLRLPSEGGVYALDTYLGEPQLLPLDQSTGEVNRHVKRNVLRATINPIAGAKYTVEIAGPSAKVQVHAALPTVYVNLDPEDEGTKVAQSNSKKPTAELSWDRYKIVRMQVKGDKRIVGASTKNKNGDDEEFVPVDAEQLGEGWVKITPKEPIKPGEYALAEMLGKEGMNSYVWDFGVHPDAPANLAVIRPEHREKAAPDAKARELKKKQ